VTGHDLAAAAWDGTGALAALATVAGSTALLVAVARTGRFRARIWRSGRHLLRRRYDYRDEWLRFVATLSADGGPPLAERVVLAVADVAGAAGGALWWRDGGGRLRLAASRNLALPAAAGELGSGEFPEAGAGGEVLEATARQGAPDGGRTAAGASPATAVPGAWLLLPLAHRGETAGLILLARPRLPRRPDAEERLLLGTLAQAAASYLAEDAASRALRDARAFEAFTRRFALVTHDLKHVATQLSLTAANARRFRGDPAFYEDLLATLDGTNARVAALLAALRAPAGGEGAGERAPAAVDLARLLRDLVRDRPAPRRPRLATPLPRLEALVEPGRLSAALNHLLDNAFEAGGTGDVELALRHDEAARAAVIEVSDDGSGMDATYLREDLARPFVSTKPQGLGIGVYAARAATEAAGGRLEVASRPGRGTIVRLILPPRPRGDGEGVA
jgi:putative PEP-CTERM system histidine kinase